MSVDPVSLAITAALTAAQMAMQASQKIEGQRLDDLGVSVADYGTPLNYFLGDRVLTCAIFFAEDMKEVKQQRKTKGGKYNDYTYKGTWASVIADHQIAAVTKIWFDKHLVYDATGAGPVTPFSLGDGFNLTDSIRFYLGTEDQEADPRMLATLDGKYGAGSTPAFRGVAYIFFEEIPLDKFGNRVPQVSVEAITAATPHYPYRSVDTPTHDISLSSLIYSPDYSRFLITDGTYYRIWDAAAAAPMIDGPLPATLGSPGVSNNGTIYGLGGSGVIAVTPDGLSLDGDFTTPGYQGGLRVLQDGRGAEHVVTLPQAFIGYFSTFTIGGLGSPVTINTWEIGDLTGWTPRGACTDSYGDIWVAGSIAGFFGSWDDLFLYRLVDTGARPGSSGFVHLNHGHFGNGSATPIIHSNGKFYVHWDGFRLLAIDDTTMTITDDLAVSENVGGGGAINFRNFRPGAPSVWIGFSEISLSDGSTIRTVDPYDWKTEDSRTGPVYDQVNNALISHPQYSAVVTWRYLDRVAASTITLADVVQSVAARCGLDPANMDASDLDQEIEGYSWTIGPAKDILDPLLTAYASVVHPHDFGIKFRKLGAASGGTIPTAKFVRQSDVRYKLTLTADTDLPRRVSFAFADKDADQQTNAAVSQRPLDAVDTTRDTSIDMTTLVLDATTAKQLSDRWFRRQWFERDGVSNALTMQLAALEPCDVQTLDLDGEADSYRLKKLSVGADGILACQWVRDDPSIADLSGAVGASMAGRAQPAISVGILAKGFVLDIPLLTDADNTVNPLLYFGAAPYSSGAWPGAIIYERIGGEYVTEWASVASSSGLTWGYASEALAEANYRLWDRGNSVNVIVKNGALTNTTEALCNGTPSVNLALLGDELIQFTTATLETDGSYTLSGLKRGRRGTEWAVGSHAIGEAFIMLDKVGHNEMGASDLGTDLSFKAVTGGRDTASAFPIPVSYTGASLKPYAPAHLSATIDAGTGDWIFTWVRRTRIGGDWTSATSIPLGEATEAYELDILDGGTVVRTLSVTSPTVTYSAADQTADFGAPQTSIDVAAYQISTTVDRGFPATASF